LFPIPTQKGYTLLHFLFSPTPVSNKFPTPEEKINLSFPSHPGGWGSKF
jgi:hypothetical protein